MLQEVQTIIDEGSGHKEVVIFVNGLVNEGVIIC